MSTVFVIKREWSDDPDTIEITSTVERAEAMIAALPLNHPDDKHYYVEIEVDALYERLQKGTLTYGVTIKLPDTVTYVHLADPRDCKTYAFREYNGTKKASVYVTANSQAEAVEKAKTKLAAEIESGEYEQSLQKYDAWYAKQEARLHNRNE